MKLNLMDEPNKDCVLQVLETGTDYLLDDSERLEALNRLRALPFGATVRDFVNTLDSERIMIEFSAALKRSFLVEPASSGADEPLVCSTARRYKVTGIDDAEAYLIWPITSNEGDLALIMVDLAYRSDFCDKTSKVTDLAIELVKQYFVPTINCALVMESVAGEPNNFAQIIVVNQDASHQDFGLVWNFVSHEGTFKQLGLPADLLEYPFVESPLPQKLPLTKLQRDHEDALQRQADTYDLLDCLNRVKELLTRNPGKIRMEVSEETAIALLAAHGQMAAEALEGIERFPDNSVCAE